MRAILSQVREPAASPNFSANHVILIGTGTTPKMIGSEKDILFVGYGAMLVEGVVAIMALVAACVLVPADYFAINATPAAFAKLGMEPVALPQLAQAVGEQLQGRPGGAVSLAVGMAYIFSGVPFMKHLTSYWYHFAIMFEAVVILTAVDTGTRVGRYMLQEMLGKVWPALGRPRALFSTFVTSLLFTASWGYLVYTGDIATIWPLFGMANQLLATCALVVGTTLLIRLGKARYAWISAAPALFMIPVTMSAGYLNIARNYAPGGKWLLAGLCLVLMLLMAVVFVEAIWKWALLLRVREHVLDRYGKEVVCEVEDERPGGAELDALESSSSVEPSSQDP